MLKKMLFISSLMLILTALAPAHAQVSAEVVVGAPPAPQVEAIPVAPGPAYVWQAGYWRWHHGAYVWVPGHYVSAPYAGAVWIGPQWVQRGGSWVLVGGHWRH